MTDADGKLELSEPVPGVTGAALVRALVDAKVLEEAVSTQTIGNWRKRGMPGVYVAAEKCWRYQVAACAAWVRSSAAVAGPGGSDARRHGGTRAGAGRKASDERRVTSDEKRQEGAEKSGRVGNPTPGSKDRTPPPAPSLREGGQGRTPPLPLPSGEGFTRGASTGLLEDVAIAAAEQKAARDKMTAEQQAAAERQDVPEALVRLIGTGLSLADAQVAPLVAGLSRAQQDKLKGIVQIALDQANLGEQLGRLIDREEVDLAVKQHAAAVAAAVESLPDRVAAGLAPLNVPAAVAAAVRQVVEEGVHQAMELVRKGLELEQTGATT